MARFRQRINAALAPGTIALAHDHGHDASGGAGHGTGHGADPHDPGRSARRQRPHGAARPPLVPLGRGHRLPHASGIGEKAVGLAWLARQGVAVPPAVAIPADVAARIAIGDTLTVELLAGALARWLDPDGRYAVRSSADVDDGPAPGRAEARVDVASTDVIDAIRVVAGQVSPGFRTQAGEAGGAAAQRAAVVIQQMVPAASSGVAFSRNPLTGLDEVVVEAVPGRGDEPEEEGATPDRWVRRWGAFIEAPADPGVPPDVVEKVARETTRLARERGYPIDLDWTHDGSTLWWLQIRPMRGLDDLHVYSNRIAREVMPGVIKPLVWSVNVPVVNGAWIAILEELVGPLDLRPEDLARTFGHRAYFDMTTLGAVFEALGMPRDSLELLLGLPKGPEAPGFRPSAGVLRHVPRMGMTAWRTLGRGRWARREVAELQAAYAALTTVDPASLDEPALLARVEALMRLGHRAAYANIIVPLVMLAYSRALERQVTAAGLDATAADPAIERRDRSTWDPNQALDALRVVADRLPDEARQRLTVAGSVALAEREDLAPLRQVLDDFMSRFGHLSERGSDFSVSTWRESPDHVIGLILDHGERSDVDGRVALDDVLARVPAPRRPLVRLLWRRAGAFRVYREAVTATYTRGNGHYRATFLALGGRLAEREVLDAPDDVFYLTLGELQRLTRHEPLESGDPRSVAAARRAEVEEAAELIVPDTVYGDAFVPRRREDVAAAVFHGIPTSRGSVRAPARVVRGAEDFARVQPGDVIVIPFSDVAWTPLFARASGVVAESGGILSHSSIVAREYGIPCVVSVSDACSAVPDGATVVVDGVAGTVLVEGNIG